MTSPLIGRLAPPKLNATQVQTLDYAHDGGRRKQGEPAQNPSKGIMQAARQFV
jgi:hypothetical protein